MTTAMVSMKAVETHCAACSVTSRSSISRGIALIMIVSLRITTKVASTSSFTTGGVRPGMPYRAVRSVERVSVIVDLVPEKGQPVVERGGLEQLEVFLPLEDP